MSNSTITETFVDSSISAISSTEISSSTITENPVTTKTNEVTRTTNIQATTNAAEISSTITEDVSTVESVSNTMISLPTTEIRIVTNNIFETTTTTTTTTTSTARTTPPSKVPDIIDIIKNPVATDSVGNSNDSNTPSAVTFSILIFGVSFVIAAIGIAVFRFYAIKKSEKFQARLKPFYMEDELDNSFGNSQQLLASGGYQSFSNSGENLGQHSLTNSFEAVPSSPADPLIEYAVGQILVDPNGHLYRVADDGYAYYLSEPVIESTNEI